MGEELNSDEFIYNMVFSLFSVTFFVGLICSLAAHKFSFDRFGFDRSVGRNKNLGLGKTTGVPVSVHGRVCVCVCNQMRSKIIGLHAASSCSL